MPPLYGDTNLQKALYNPGLLSRQALIRTFVARRPLYEGLITGLRNEEMPTAGRQHILLLGPRGMGKTTLLLRLRYGLGEAPDLKARYEPILFSEESYGIGDIADLWLETLRRWTATSGDRRWARAADRLLATYRNDAEMLAAMALDALREGAEAAGKTLVLLLDNLQEVLNHIGDERELHELRAVLMDTPWLKVIAGAPGYFSHIESSRGPFYEFFQVTQLRGISQEETLHTLRQWAEQEGRRDVVRRLQTRPGRIKSLHHLTGGNPRLTTLIYELVREGPAQTTFKDLEHLVDQATPYFKALTDVLSPQARRVVDALARRWNPTTAKEIAEDLRLSSSQVSAIVGRLRLDGWVTPTGQQGRGQRYELAERFYNIAYLFRHARGELERLKVFVEFLQALYEDDELQGLARGIATFQQGLASDERAAEEYRFATARLSLLARACSEESRPEIFEMALRSVRERPAWVDALAQVIDLDLAREVLGAARVEQEGRVHALKKKDITGPLNPVERKRLGSDLLMIQDADGALSYLSAPVGEVIDLESALLLARAHLARGEGEDALGVLNPFRVGAGAEGALRAELMRLRAEALQQLHRPWEGAAALEAGLKDQPEDPTLRWALAAHLVKTLDRARGLEMMMALAEEGALSGDQLRHLCDALAKAGRGVEQEPFLRRAAETSPEARGALALYLWRLGFRREGARELQGALSEGIPTQGVLPLMRQAWAADWGDGALRLAEALEARQGSVRREGRLYRILAADRGGRGEEARALMAETLAEGFDEARLIQWGGVFLEEGAPALGEVVGRRALDQDPEHPGAMALVARALLAQGRAEEGLPFAEGAAKGAPEEAEHWVLWAMLSLKRADPKGGEAMLPRWAQAQPRDPRLAALIFLAARSLGEGAADAFPLAQVLDRAGDVKGAESLLTFVSEIRVDAALVEACARHLLSLNPGARAAREHLMAALYRQERWDDLIEVSGRAVEATADEWAFAIPAVAVGELSDPTNDAAPEGLQTPWSVAAPVALAALSETLRGAGRLEDALGVAQRGLRSHPEHAGLLLAWAECAAAQGLEAVGRREEVHEIARTLLGSRGATASQLVRASALVEAGNPALTRALAERAVALAPRVALIWKHFFYTLRLMWDLPGAEKAYAEVQRRGLQVAAAEGTLAILKLQKRDLRGALPHLAALQGEGEELEQLVSLVPKERESPQVAAIWGAILGGAPPGPRSGWWIRQAIVSAIAAIGDGAHEGYVQTLARAVEGGAPGARAVWPHAAGFVRALGALLDALNTRWDPEPLPVEGRIEALVAAAPGFEGEVWLGLCELLARHGDGEAARSAALKALAYGPQAGEAARLLLDPAVCSLDALATVLAEPGVKRALQEDAELRRRVFERLLSAGRADAALDAAEALLKEAPSDPLLILDRALLLRAQGAEGWEEAAAQALALPLDTPEAHLGMAARLDALPDQPEEWMGLLRTAHDRWPQDPQVALAYAHAALNPLRGTSRGDLRALQGSFVAIVRLFGGHPTGRILQGMLALKQGRAEEGLSHLRTALAHLEPLRGLYEERRSLLDQAQLLALWLAALGQGQAVADLIDGLPRERRLEPLRVGLALYLGDDARLEAAPREVQNAAAVLQERIEALRRALEGQSA